MSLVSKFFFEDITYKLQLEMLSKLGNKKMYADHLLEKISNLENLTKSEDYFCNISPSVEKSLYLNSFYEDYSVVYIIRISFLRTNTIIHILDAKGNVKNFFTSGSVGLVGKQKYKRSIALTRLIDLIIKKVSYVGSKPIALHLSNVRSQKRLILKKLKSNFFIKIVKVFNRTPFNGCRKKKVRRKKSSKRVMM